MIDSPTPPSGSTIRPIHQAFTDILKDSKTSQALLAKRSFKTTTQVSRALTGKVKLDIDGWRTLGDALRVPVLEFIKLYYPHALQEEAEAPSVEDHPGARLLVERVAKVMQRIEENPVEGLYEAAEMDTNWTVPAAAYLASEALARSMTCLPVALYFYGRVLQDRDLPTRAHKALHAARLLAEEEAGVEGARLLPYVLLSLGNLAVEDNREPEGIGIFDDIRERHEAGVTKLTDPRQLAHLHGFGSEARVLRRVEMRRSAASSANDPALLQAAAELDVALKEVAQVDRPHWTHRFMATRGLVRVLRGDGDGLKDIAVGRAWFVKHRSSPSEYDAGSYIHAVNLLCHALLNTAPSEDERKEAVAAESLARRNGTFVAMRVFALARSLAPLLLLVALVLVLMTPGVALAAFHGNGC